MFKGFPIFPESASSISGQVDLLYFFLIAITLFFSALIFTLVIVFAIKYRRKSDDERPKPIHGDMRLEILWSVIPLGIVLFVFAWGAHVYFQIVRAPANAMNINVVAKQWMWKFQHPTGQREINDLHLPVGQPIKLTMISEDVIHSLFVPAFRVKQDVLPGRHTTLWFEPTKVGKYHLFCTEYCGTKHAGMGGWVYVMEPADYQDWLAGNVGNETPVEAGARLFTQHGCITCHRQDTFSRGPSLHGLYGRDVRLSNGEVVKADEDYLRQSILDPKAKMVEGFDAIMPTFQGQVSEEDILSLIEYIKSLKAAASTETGNK